MLPTLKWPAGLAGGRDYVGFGARTFLKPLGGDLCRLENEGPAADRRLVL